MLTIRSTPLLRVLCYNFTTAFSLNPLIGVVLICPTVASYIRRPVGAKCLNPLIGVVLICPFCSLTNVCHALEVSLNPLIGVVLICPSPTKSVRTQ